MKPVFFQLFILVILIGAIPINLHAQEEHRFEGLYLFGGGGANTSTYHSDSARIDWGIGLNLKTDFGYYFTDKWAVEWSSLSKFTRVDGYLVWDTLITWGIRHQFSIWSTSSMYGRLFAGRAPTMIKFEGSVPDEFKRQGVDRIRLDGPVYGGAVGRTKTSRGGWIWFIEFIGTVQSVETVEDIQIIYEVPEVSFHQAIGEETNIVSFYICTGIHVF